jgi:hypothetical protein
MRFICEIFGAPRFSSFSTQSTQSGHAPKTDQLLTLAVSSNNAKELLPAPLLVVRDGNRKAVQCR